MESDSRAVRKIFLYSLLVGVILTILFLIGRKQDRPVVEKQTINQEQIPFYHSEGKE